METDFKKVVTEALGEYTEEFLIPKIGELLEDSEQRTAEKINLATGELKHELKEYLDQKLDYYTTDIFRRLDKKYQKEKQFKEKVVELFKKHQIGSTEDLAYLEGLVQGS